MADLHRLGDYSQPQRRNQFDLGPNQHRIPFLSPIYQTVPPRKETYFQMLKTLLFPKMKLRSVTVLLIFTLVVVFAVCLLDGIETEGTLLQVKKQSLIRIGALSPKDIKEQYYYHQTFLSLFLNFDLIQFLGVIMWVGILGSNVEFAIGSKSMAIITILGSMTGCLFGTFINCCTDQYFINSKVLIYTLIGAVLGSFILNWDALQALQDLRCFLMCFIWLAVVFLMLFTFSPGSELKLIDKYACLGGLMAGFFLNCAIATPVKSDGFEQKVKFFGWTFFTILLLTSLIMIQIL